VALAVLAATNTAAFGADADPKVTVQDRPGAPREMLQQLEKLTGHPAGTLKQVTAVDTGGKALTPEQIEALAAGKEPDGVKVLGVMPGSKELLETTISDLSDGTYDGPRDSTELYRSAVVFDLFLPGYEWCLTICISTGRSVSECIELSRR
jgi:hypothetical protein